MTAARVTKLLCPSCKGSGKFICGLPCMWCKGIKRVPVKTALQYADQCYMIAGGGYIAGDHSYGDMREMEREAETVYKWAQQTPPWKGRR